MRGRYSIIGLKPDLVWRCPGDRAEINRRALRMRDAFEPLEGGALQSLRTLIAECRIDVPAKLPPMAAGLFGYMGYDIVRLMERLPDDNPDPLGIPDAVFLRPDRGRDLRQCRGSGHGGDAGLAGPGGAMRAQAYEDALNRLAEVVADFDRPLPHQARGRGRAAGAARAGLERDAASAITRWSSGRRSTSAPATSSRWCPRSASTCPSRCRPSRSTARCAASTPRRSCSSSISAAMRWWARARRSWCGCATARSRSARSPAPGRAARTPEEDRALAADLLADPKELAEHLMLLDLGRNDVGRVAKIGTVKVTEKMVIEYYSHVMHIVSNVEGDDRPEIRRDGRADRGLPRGHRLRRAQGAGDGDHRRAGARAPQLLWRRGRLFRRRTARWTPASRSAPRW